MTILIMYDSAPSSDHICRLRQIRPDIEIKVAEDEKSAQAGIRDAEILLGHRYLRESLPHARRLKWVQTTAAGIDHIPRDMLAEGGVTLTRTTLGSSMIARHAVALAWAITRRLPDAFQRQIAGLWDQDFEWLPYPEQALVMGMGGIGCEIARLLSRDGIRVTGVRRRNIRNTPGFFSEVRIQSDHRWQEVLPKTDWLFMALPSTSETDGMVDEKILRMLPRHAVLVNVGRGPTLVTEDLVRVLREGHLGGVGLDVVSPVPGPGDSLWKVPRLLITPHIAARYHGREQEIEHYCEAQVARYLAGEPLHNIVST